MFEIMSDSFDLIYFIKGKLNIPVIS